MGDAFSQRFYSALPQELDEKFEQIHFVPVVSGDDPTWGGRKGFVHHAVIEDFDSLEPFDIYACGSPVMIDASKKILFPKKCQLIISILMLLPHLNKIEG